MSVNKIILVGNVGKDPEIKYFDNDNVKANFSVATSERGYTAANGTQVPERTEWHNIVCWRGLAQVVEKFVKKGTQVYIEGKLRTRSYDDQNGVKRYITEVYADNMELLSRRGGAPEHSDSSASNANERSYNAPNSSPDSVADLSNNVSDVDDLPF
ncbi:MAG TPA: single-stranded DNA-binding protein [Porphyromonadaceae bacterium]|jgi:single-strand DNA-binding protein|nr:single-stranded DNA-binding protein [Porphyromonadaceae bacterium]HBK30992.1 single-stranded DNA-binding protein [Porphyromonadaceae bacterium]HBL33510.1 single-stranded DNA-binding protein [Porphyromonadaceae bacterium]HBX19596.1 single-stranded DNA-binding protein [Porphyromonadaceae bacterium]HCM19328.1 single-stranded DNA-binding protein [Porphyromonadaceae bacterium]